MILVTRGDFTRCVGAPILARMHDPHYRSTGPAANSWPDVRSLQVMQLKCRMGE